MTKKNHYKLIADEFKVLENGTQVFRIEALVDGPWGPKGTKGGFIESELNLEQGSKAWVTEEAQVFGNAKVLMNSKICGNIKLGGKVLVLDQAEIKGRARLENNEIICGNMIVGK